MAGPTPAQARALRELIDALELAEDKLIAKAVKAVGKVYAGVDLRQVLALYAQAVTPANPQGRLAMLPLLMGEVDKSAASLARAMASLAPLGAEAVTLGSRATGDLIRVLAPGLSFDLRPERELAYMADVQKRYAANWAHESPRFRAEVQGVIERGLERGIGPRQIGRELADRLKVSRSRANLIAANEVSNARAYAMAQTQAELGVTRYDWSATGGKAGDGRTRPLHRRLHKTRHEWGKPGPAEQGAHPGQAIRCRCVALPVVDDLIEAQETADAAALAPDPEAMTYEQYLAAQDALTVRELDAVKRVSVANRKVGTGEMTKAEYQAIENREAAVLRDIARERKRLERLELNDPLDRRALGELRPGETEAERVELVRNQRAYDRKQAQEREREREAGRKIGDRLRQDAARVRGLLAQADTVTPELEAVAVADLTRQAEAAALADPGGYRENMLRRAIADRSGRNWDAALLRAPGEAVKVQGSRVKLETQALWETNPDYNPAPAFDLVADVRAILEYVDVPGLEGRVAIGTQNGGRAYARPGMIVLDAMGPSRKTALHEMGHWVENESAQVKEEALAFFRYRTAGRELADLADLRPGYGYIRGQEMVYKGAFDWPRARSLGEYTGKLYGDTLGEPTATELISVGLERMYVDPADFAKDDPEFFDFIYTVVRGGRWRY